MKKQQLIIGVTLFLICIPAFAVPRPFAKEVCSTDSRFTCMEVSKGESWGSLFPDDQQRALVMRVNRMNIGVHGGMLIIVPKNLNASLLDLSPLNRQIPAPGRKTIIVDQAELAFGAYSADGQLVRWGPVSGGKGYCPDLGRSCRTVTGSFTVYSKGGADCISTKFPIPEGGAPMPYCMFFHGGYALHGSPSVPGFNASHGCVRLFTEDAQWLNHNFVDYSTRVIVRLHSGVATYAVQDDDDNNGGVITNDDTDSGDDSDDDSGSNDTEIMYY